MRYIKNKEINKMKNNEQKVTMKRNTVIKLIIDEETYRDQDKQRQYLSNVFNCPALLEQQTEIIKSVVINNEEISFSKNTEKILEHCGIVPECIDGFKQTENKTYTRYIDAFTDFTKKTLEIDMNTRLYYQYTNSDYLNNVTIRYIELKMRTQGTNKTEISAIHKANVHKLIHYLRENKVPYAYDCEWEFEGSRQCKL